MSLGYCKICNEYDFFDSHRCRPNGWFGRITTTKPMLLKFMPTTVKELQKNGRIVMTPMETIR